MGVLRVLLIFFLLLAVAVSAAAGPYPPAAQQEGSHAVSMDDPALVSWAQDYADYFPGENIDSTWQTPENALGQAQGSSFDVVSLGEGGEITLIFDPPIQNGEGWDFAVFENSFEDIFLELGYVEVSSDGESFIRFDSVSLTAGPVPGFGNLDPTDIDGLAGKYRQGYGTPFDLEALFENPLVLAGDVDLNAITYVRIIDVIGDGTCFDASGAVIYDPYPTQGSAGFDLDAVGVSNGAPYPEDEYVPPEIPEEEGKSGFGSSGSHGCFVDACRY
jgi:hypothetical protein